MHQLEVEKVEDVEKVEKVEDVSGSRLIQNRPLDPVSVDSLLKTVELHLRRRVTGIKLAFK